MSQISLLVVTIILMTSLAHAFIMFLPTRYETFEDQLSDDYYPAVYSKQSDEPLIDAVAKQPLNVRRRSASSYVCPCRHKLCTLECLTRK